MEKDTREVNVSTPELPTREARRAAIIFLTKEFKVGQTFRGKKIVAAVTVEGVKLNFMDGCSLLIRASGTEPKFRVVPETKIEEEVSILVEVVKRRLIP